MTPASSRSLWPLLAAALVIAAATLSPSGDSLTEGLSLCLICGTRGLADALRNVVLFVPLGASLAGRRNSVRTTLLAGATLALTVELLQHVIPGRDPSAGDLLFNTLGAGLGWGLVASAASWLLPSPRTSRRLLLAAVLLPLSILGAGAWLLTPSLPRTVYFGQWTADLGGSLEWYHGRVLRATVGGLEVGSRSMGDRSAILRSLLARGAPVHVLAVAGPPVVSLAPVFSIYDEWRDEILLLGVDGDDAVLRIRLHARDLRLDEPDLRLRGVFREVSEGDQLVVSSSRRDRRYCVAVNQLTSCALGFTVGDSWTLLLYPSSLPPLAQRLISLLWIAAWFVPAGLWIRRRYAFAATGAIVAGLWIIPFVAGGMLTPVPQMVAAVAGVVVGVLLARLLRARGERRIVQIGRTP